MRLLWLLHIYDPGLRFPNPPPTPPQCDDPVHTTHCSNDYNMAASLLLWRWVGRNIGTPLHAVTKSPTPSNLIGSMMILRVLPIHVPPCYEGGYLKPTPLKPHMTYDDHHSTSIIRRQCKDKGHSSHPQEKPQSTFTGGGRGEVHYIGRGGGACQTWIIWNTFSCRNKKLTPSNMIGSMMIIRVLLIHVPPCYEGGIP